MSTSAIPLSDNQDLQNRAAALLSYLILASGIATIGVAAYMVVICYTRLPWSDGWTQIFVGARGENPFSLHWLWQQHNEHRLLIPKIFLALDLRFFAARQKLLLAVIFIVQLLEWWLLCWSMRYLGGWRRAQWRTGAGLAAFCLFCPSQWENLTWGFQTCFVLPGFCATLSFVALLLYWERSQRHVAGAEKVHRLIVARRHCRNLFVGEWFAAAPLAIVGCSHSAFAIFHPDDVCDHRTRKFPALLS